jgi:predicted TIM-barrel fold metal-dependent hydrolase
MVAGRYVDVIAETVGLLSALEGVPMVLMHSGSVRLLEMAEVVRGFPSALLDLSFTLCKYEGSSLDDDLYFLFRTMDQRLCVGSDYPEFSARDLRRRFNRLATGLCRHRAENIGFRNLSTVLGGAV